MLPLLVLPSPLFPPGAGAAALVQQPPVGRLTDNATRADAAAKEAAHGRWLHSLRRALPPLTLPLQTALRGGGAVSSEGPFALGTAAAPILGIRPSRADAQCPDPSLQWNRAGLDFPRVAPFPGAVTLVGVGDAGPPAALLQLGIVTDPSLLGHGHEGTSVCMPDLQRQAVQPVDLAKLPRRWFDALGDAFSRGVTVLERPGAAHAWLRVVHAQAVPTLLPDPRPPRPRFVPPSPSPALQAMPVAGMEAKAVGLWRALATAPTAGAADGAAVAPASVAPCDAVRALVPAIVPGRFILPHALPLLCGTRSVLLVLVTPGAGAGSAGLLGGTAVTVAAPPGLRFVGPAAAWLASPRHVALHLYTPEEWAIGVLQVRLARVPGVPAACTHL